MRAFSALLATLAVALAVSGLAVAGGNQPSPSPANGSLAIDNGRGVITVQGVGGMNGRFDSGRLYVDDDLDGNGHGIDVNGAKRVRETKAGTIYEGENVSFIVKGSDRFKIRIVAVGVDMWVVGRGSVILDGSGFTDAGRYELDAGRYQLNGAGWTPMPTDEPSRLVLGAAQQASAAR
jgi:hypothetical protein